MAGSTAIEQEATTSRSPNGRPAAARRVSGARATDPVACVLGNTNLIHALGLAGIRCAAVARRDAPAAFSKFVDARVEWADNWGDPEGLRANLLRFAAQASAAPVLFYQHDGDLVFVSRHRDVLAEHMRFVVGEEQLIEDLVDKTRFCDLARRTGLPVPPSTVLRPRAGEPAPDLELDYPIILKPLTRRDREWRPIAGAAKALEVESPARFGELWHRLAERELDLVAQQLVPGEEDRIESYHAYVDERGDVAGEFTGRKLRTVPRRLGDTTALTITDAGDVRELGRECMRLLGLRGVAKLDFKRAPDGRLFLFEVNARFNLWHLPGAIAGVNLPALVYADLAERPRPRIGPVRAGVTWSLPWKDVRAAREAGMSLAGWLAWQLRSDSSHVISLDDPMPFLRGMLWRHARGRLRRRR